MGNLAPASTAYSASDILALLNGNNPIALTQQVTVNNGTLTASTPAISVSQTWNNAGVTFTGLRLNVTNTASGASSLLADLQVGGVSQWHVDRSGNVTATGSITGGAGSFTTLNATGLIQTSTTGSCFASTGASTSYRQMTLQNTSGNIYVGVESSVAGSQFTGSAAYDAVIYSSAHLYIAGFGGIKLGGGDVTTTGAITVGTTLSVTGVVTLNSTAASSSTTTGALVVSGGVGVAKDSVFGQRLAVAAGLTSLAMLAIGDSSTTNPLSGTNQQGFRADITGTSASTAAVFAGVCIARTAASAFTCALAAGGYYAFSTLGAGSTVTRAAGIIAERATAGTNQAGLCIIDGGGSPAWTGTYAIACESTQPSLFAGGLTSKHATQGIGYATGAGGTVTQATSKSTGVTLNTVCGQITMNAAALAAGAKVSFTLTNSAIAATDEVTPWVVSGGTANAYRASTTAVAAGSCTITVENITGGSLSEAPVIGFAVRKAVTS